MAHGGTRPGFLSNKCAERAAAGPASPRLCHRPELPHMSKALGLSMSLVQCLCAPLTVMFMSAALTLSISAS